jgi:hypothetical protein
MSRKRNRRQKRKASGGGTAVATAPHPPERMRRIAALAYSLWDQSGRPEGNDQENWYEAERIMMKLRPD